MSGDRSRWNVQYMQRVLATDPIGYWMQNEKQGLVSYDMVTARSDGARNGAYTGVTLGQPGIGDGRTSGLYDGLAGFDDIFTPSLQAAFNGDEGTALIWGQVSGAPVWAGGARTLINFQVDANNQAAIKHRNVANDLTFTYLAGGVAETRSVASASLIFFSGMITWSAAADEVRAYLDGVQQGATMGALGVWAGNLNAIRVCIGATNTGPAELWDGWLAHGAVWDRALSPAAALSLGVR